MSGAADPAGIGWVGIVRLGCVQAALGAIVVLTTSTMNRVMAVELSLPAILPASLVALHYAVQILRPLLGHGSDKGGRRTPWICGGMALLGAGALLAALAIAQLHRHPGIGGMALAVLGFLAIGLGVGTSGTALLTLLGQQVAPGRRPAAASAVWMMMIAGIALTAGLAGHFLQPFSPRRLLAVTGGVAVLAQAVTLLATWGIETPVAARPATAAASIPFGAALRQVWGDAQARRFTGFVGLSMLAYSAQELVLEPFAGAVFRMTPGQTAELTSLQHGGALLGMLAVALLGARWHASLRRWTLGGCTASAIALAVIGCSGLSGRPVLLHGGVFALGVSNGAFAVAAIGAMMQLSATGARPGVRIGLWGAAQALAFALGGLLGAGASDAARSLTASPGLAYGGVLLGEALLFLLAAQQAARAFPSQAPQQATELAGRGVAA